MELLVPYVHNLYRHLAACDLAVVQGGLERYGAGRRMDFDGSPPERIAAAIAEEIGREVSYRDVEVDGAAQAAQRLAELL